MKDEDAKKNVSGGETEGGITSSYATNDGVALKVSYAFMGSIYDEAEEKAAIEAMHQDTLTMGPKVGQFQTAFAKMCGVKHARAVTNCTTGMHVATQVFDIKEGDEVIVTPITFIATSLVILKEKAIPVYADIDPRTFNIDPRSVASKVTRKTKAIYVVHYGGQVVDMDPIMEIARKHHLLVMEDCAHAHAAEYKGRKAGSLGDIGVFSFHSLKNMTTCGEGGMITTNNDEFAEGVDKLRCMNLKDWDPGQREWQFGEARIVKEGPIDYWLPSHFDVDTWKGHWGNNYRMNEIQAAVGLAQLDKLEMLTKKRREIAAKITKGLTGIRGITPPYVAEYGNPVFHLYTVCVEEKELGASRDEFLRVLYKEEGIQGILHYQPTFHLSALKKMGYDPYQCPNATKFFYKREFNLPMHPRLTDNDIAMMVQGIRNAATKVAQRAVKA
jgi:perosamine synthetase